MAAPGSGIMSFRGTLNKFGFLFLMVMATAFYVWNEASVGNSIQGYLMGGAIGGLVIALILMFKQQWAQYLAPAYALLEGLVVGGISAIYSNAFSKVAPGIVTQAVVLTFGTAIAMYLLYTFRIIKVTERFRSIMFAAIGFSTWENSIWHPIVGLVIAALLFAYGASQLHLEIVASGGFSFTVATGVLAGRLFDSTLVQGLSVIGVGAIIVFTSIAISKKGDAVI